VSFDGRPSSDDRLSAPSGTVVSWRWSFGDGGSASGAQVSHAFARARTYAVSLRVADDDGKVDTKTLNVVVGRGATSITTTASPDTVLGAGALIDRAMVSGRVNPALRPSASASMGRVTRRARAPRCCARRTLRTPSQEGP